MKITLAEFERTDGSPPLEMFIQGIKAEETREKYTRSLRRVLCNVFEELLEGTFEERAAQLVERGRENPEWLRDLLLILSKKLRDRTELARDDPQTTAKGTFTPILAVLLWSDPPLVGKLFKLTLVNHDHGHSYVPVKYEASVTNLRYTVYDIKARMSKNHVGT